MRISRTLLALGLAAPLAAAPTPEAGAQIAAGYPGDVGLDQDQRVILYEDFESGDVSDLAGRWEQVMNAGGMSFTGAVPAGSGGSRALRMTASNGNTGGHLYTRLPSSPDTVYLRAYVRYMGGNYQHTGPWLGGYNPPTSFPQGGSGERPAGNERFTVGFEPVDFNQRLDFYSYWMGMTGFGPGQYWGNSFIQDPNLRVRTGDWMCVEVMIKLNQPVGSTNGELAAWIDGQQVAHLGQGFPNVLSSPAVWTPDPNGAPFPGFQWRNDSGLATNFVWLLLFADGDAEIQWDHVVAATDYIGPIHTGPPDPPDDPPDDPPGQRPERPTLLDAP